MKKNDYNSKYKVISPKETVNNVKKFFEDNGYQVYISENRESEAGTWFCGVHLYYNGMCVQAACGKGMTEEFSLASGYAELYERFCNKCPVSFNPFFSIKHIDKNKDKMHPMILDDILQVPSVDGWIKAFGNPTYQRKEELFNILTNGEPLGVEYNNFDLSNDIFIMDPRIIDRVYMSIGMAAGNTVTEALNQGLSEIYEHYAAEHFLRDPQEKYYLIDLDNIKNESLKEKVNLIRAFNYDFFVFDLSYNYNMPVLLSCLINKTGGTSHLNFGSFPVFDIALERIITETYQGIYSLNDYPSELQIPSRALPSSQVWGLYGNNITLAPYLPEFIFENCEIAKNYNEQVFLSDDLNLTNEEIHAYYCELNKKLGYSFYFRDNSLSDDIHAIRIWSPEMEMTTDKGARYKNTSKLIIDEWINSLYAYVDYVNRLIDGTLTPEDFIHHITNYATGDNGKGGYIGCFMCVDWLTPLYPTLFTNYLDAFGSVPYVNIDEFNVFVKLQGSFMYPIYRRYATLYNFKMCYQYTNEELINYMKLLLNWTPTEQDIENVEDKNYFIQRVIIDSIHRFFHSDIYDNYVSTFNFREA